MTIKSAALAVVLALGASQAMAQPLWYDDGPMGRGAVPPREVAAIVRSTGLTPVTPPARVGPNYVVHAVDRYGETMRVVIDADFGEVVRIRPLGPRMAGPGGWTRWNGPRIADDLGVRQWWNTTPPRPRRSVPVARAPIAPDDALPRPRTDPPAVIGAPADPADAPPATGAAAPEGLPPPPPVNAARTPRSAPLPKPRPSAEQMAAKPATGSPAEAKPRNQPRVVLPGGPAVQGEKAVEATGTVPAPAAAAPAAPQNAPAPAAPAPAVSGTPPMVPMQTLE